jgi:hypothetical protein
MGLSLMNDSIGAAQQIVDVRQTKTNPMTHPIDIVTGIEEWEAGLRCVRLQRDSARHEHLAFSPTPPERRGSCVNFTDGSGSCWRHRVWR